MNKVDLKLTKQKLQEVRAELAKNPDSAGLKSEEMHYSNELKNDSLLNNIFKELQDEKNLRVQAEQIESISQENALAKTNKMLGLEINFTTGDAPLKEVNTNITE